MMEMVFNKVIELATESFPGCLFQIYVWLKYPEQAGSFALGSILISALTTGFTLAMISFDLDVDGKYEQYYSSPLPFLLTSIAAKKRKVLPQFYGYIPDDNALRFRCLVLMTMISALHNLSRSLGLALIILFDKWLAIYTVVGEVGLYLVYRLLRCFEGSLRIDSRQAQLIIAIIAHSLKKILVDFRYGLHAASKESNDLLEKFYTISVDSFAP